MERKSRAFVIAPPLTLMALMLAGAAAVSARTGVEGGKVFMPYLGAWGSLTLLSVLLWIFVQVAVLASTRADRPLQIVFGKLAARDKEGFLLSALVFPLFLGAYTWAKTSIPLAVGYGWETVWANTDRALLGTDAWRIAHAWIPPAMAPAWTFFYAVVWGFALVIVGSLVSAFAGRRFSATLFTAMMLTWLTGGFVLAYAISAAGPVFAHLADPGFTERFAPLRAELLGLLGRHDIVITTQRYLEAGYSATTAVKGGGISAMPSMHIATATIFICAAWRTRWLPFAILFWLLTFVGSIYLGYHYAIDAPVAVAVAVPCWMVARRIHMRLNRSANIATAIPATPSKA